MKNKYNEQGNKKILGIHHRGFMQEKWIHAHPKPSQERRPEFLMEFDSKEKGERADKGTAQGYRDLPHLRACPE